MIKTLDELTKLLQNHEDFVVDACYREDMYDNDRIKHWDEVQPFIDLASRSRKEILAVFYDLVESEQEVARLNKELQDLERDKNWLENEIKAVTQGHYE